MTRYILNDVRRNFADNIEYVIWKKSRKIEVRDQTDYFVLHSQLFNTALKKLGIPESFNINDPFSMLRFLKTAPHQMKVNGVWVEPRKKYGPEWGGTEKDKEHCGLYFFRQWVEDSPPEIAYWISDCIRKFKPRPIVGPNGQKLWEIKEMYLLTNVPA
jgi:hypothetical protein